MHLVIGAPTNRREWIIDDWLKYALDAVEMSPWVTKLSFLLVAACNDPGFLQVRACINQLPDVELIHVEEPDDRDHDKRDWGQPGRYERMTDLRNIMLAKVREVRPNLFLSLDTDILLHPLALNDMYECLHENLDWAAVGSKAYLSEPRYSRSGEPAPGVPNYANLTGRNGLHRPDSDGTFRCHVLMAIKLMKQDAYDVDYVFAQQGEDIGWSKAVREQGWRLGWTGKHASKHVMRPRYKDEVDKRIGW